MENLNSPTTSFAYAKKCFSYMLRAFSEVISIRRWKSQDCTKRHINELEILIRNSAYIDSQHCGVDILYKHGEQKEFKSNVLLKVNLMINNSEKEP